MEILRNSKKTVDQIKKNLNVDINNISIKGSSLLGNELDSQKSFFKESFKYPGFTVLKIGITRATLKEASSFKELLERAISDDGNNIIIDMNTCEFVDSSFFAVLVGGLKRVNSMGMKFHIVHNNTENLPIFSATGLDKIFKVFNNIEEAVQN